MVLKFFDQLLFWYMAKIMHGQSNIRLEEDPDPEKTVGY